MNRRLRVPVALAAFAALLIVLSACAQFKAESLSGAQPGGIGPVRVHFLFCMEDESTGGEPCIGSDRTGQSQSSIAYSVPAGSTPPATITAVPQGTGATMNFSPNQEVTNEFEAIAIGEEEEEAKLVSEGKPAGDGPWRPKGSLVVGYLSAPYAEAVGQKLDWSVDADFGLPAGAPFAQPFLAVVGTGWRRVDGTHPANRPYKCFETTEGFKEVNAFCPLTGSNEAVEVQVSDLKVPAPSGVSADAGSSATVPFKLEFGSSAKTLPSFTLAASTTLAGATVSVSPSSYQPGGLSGGRTSTTANVSVAVPSSAAPGTYDVTLTASTATGGKVTQTGKLTVAAAKSPTPPKASLKRGKLTRNLKNGTAQLKVTVSGPGTLTLAGKKVIKAQRKPQGPGVVNLTVRAKGKAKEKLKEKGKVTVATNLTFAPVGGSPVISAGSVLLKKTLK